MGRRPGGSAIAQLSASRGRKPPESVTVSFIPLPFRGQLVEVGPGLAELGDLFFLGGNQRVELRNLATIAALLVFAEAEQVGLVLRPPAVEVEAILGDDGASQLLRLSELRPGAKDDTSLPLLGAGRVDRLAVNVQRVAALWQIVNAQSTLLV